MPNLHPKKRTIVGTVVSDAMQKTRVVAVSRQKKHPKYQRYYTVTKKFKAHDENNEYHKGDIVVMAEARPMSRDKRWVIIGKSQIAKRQSPENQEILPSAISDSQ